MPIGQPPTARARKRANGSMSAARPARSGAAVREISFGVKGRVFAPCTSSRERPMAIGRRARPWPRSKRKGSERSCGVSAPQPLRRNGERECSLGRVSGLHKPENVRLFLTLGPQVGAQDFAGPPMARNGTGNTRFFHNEALFLLRPRMENVAALAFGRNVAGRRVRRLGERPLARRLGVEEIAVNCENIRCGSHAMLCRCSFAAGVLIVATKRRRSPQR